MKQRELNVLVKKIQKILKLEGWKIKAKIVTKVETEGAMADVNYESEWKTAKIASYSPEYLKEHFGVSFRQNLIHEMLHLLIEGHKPADGPYDPQTEFAINTIAEIIDRNLTDAEERTT